MEAIKWSLHNIHYYHHKKSETTTGLIQKYAKRNPWLLELAEKRKNYQKQLTFNLKAPFTVIQLHLTK